MSETKKASGQPSNIETTMINIRNVPNKNGYASEFGPTKNDSVCCHMTICVNHKGYEDSEGNWIEDRDYYRLTGFGGDARALACISPGQSFSVRVIPKLRTSDGKWFTDTVMVPDIDRKTGKPKVDDNGKVIKRPYPVQQITLTVKEFLMWGNESEAFGLKEVARGKRGKYWQVSNSKDREKFFEYKGKLYEDDFDPDKPTYRYAQVKGHEVNAYGETEEKKETKTRKVNKKSATKETKTRKVNKKGTSKKGTVTI